MSALRRLLTAAVGRDVLDTGDPHHFDPSHRLDRSHCLDRSHDLGRARSRRRDRSAAHDAATAWAQHDHLSTLLSLR